MESCLAEIAARAAGSVMLSGGRPAVPGRPSPAHGSLLDVGPAQPVCRHRARTAKAYPV